MSTENHNRLEAFQNAFNGWLYVVKTQRNAWIHLIATVMVLLITAWLNLSLQDLAFVIIVIGLVWMAELFNTAVEALVDLASPNFHTLAGIAKDVSAAAVLIAALTAFVVGLLLLAPPLIERVQLLLN